MPAMVECRGLVYIYKSAQLEVVALQGLDLQVEAGEMVAVVGSSGSGKTTLMNVLAGVDSPSAGYVAVAGRDLARLSATGRDRYRRDVVGYVWQESMLNLTLQLTVAENLQLPMLAAGRSWRDRRHRAAELLEELDLADRRDHLPAELSGGERQRLALGVAVGGRPKVLLADEPTAELDEESAGRILAELRGLRDREGLTVITVTHDREVERHVDRVLRIRDGRVSTEARKTTGEVTVLDRQGRLQLPASAIESAGLNALVRVRAEDGRVIIEPADRPENGPS
jgi:ABC-type lipoprotein export system ATPase subunit